MDDTWFIILIYIIGVFLQNNDNDHFFYSSDCKMVGGGVNTTRKWPRHEYFY